MVSPFVERIFGFKDVCKCLNKLSPFDIIVLMFCLSSNTSYRSGNT